MDYKNAGVDIEAGYKSVELMKKHVQQTMRPEVLTGLGGFSGAFSMGKFKDMEKLKTANRVFYEKDKKETNLLIIQEYIDRISQGEIEIVCLERWTNCNTRGDFRRIQKYWEAER